MGSDKIIIKGAREHNLDNIDIEIPRDSLVVITGISGSGKSSLAFDTIYAEGQRRYVESLSSYARQFLEQLGKPDVDSIEGLSPAISIEQKTTSRNPRSTVGTITEVYDYLRVLFARVGEVYCPTCDKPIAAQTVQQIVDQVLAFGEGTRIHVLAPVVRGRKGEYRKELQAFRRDGFARVKIDGKLHRLEESITLEKNKKHDIDVVVDRIVVKAGTPRLTEAVETALRLAEGIVKVEEVDTGEIHTFSERFACIECGFSLPELAPRIFSFNNPHGACPSCDGLGYKMEFDPELVVPNPNLSIREGAVLPWENRNSVYFAQTLESLEKHFNFSIYTPWNKLPAATQKAILFGCEDEIRFFYEQGDRRYEYTKTFEGVISNLSRRYGETQSEMIREEMRRFMSVIPCSTCHGARLRPESLAVRIGGFNISQLTEMSIRESAAFFRDLELDDRRAEIGRRLLKEISERLGFLEAVGLEYLTLSRSGTTLSGGESQRIRLATQVGSSLMGVLYILDEPSIGLHQRDNDRLLRMLRRLRDVGNTVLVVEHDAETILSADHVIDLGPGAGVHGGKLVAQGTPEDICKSADSLTGKYLSGRLEISVPEARRESKRKWIEIKGASQNNLQAINVRFPIGLFTCVTGVSGSGKSTLVVDTLFRALQQRLYHSKARAGAHTEIRGLPYIDKVIDIDQSPIGRTPRSNPATYTGLFTPIRDLFAELPESRVRGYKPGRFSFNVKGGRCAACQGDGVIKVEMHFLPDVYVVCDQCGGNRYNRDTLEIKYKTYSIADILEMTVDEAMPVFASFPSVLDRLRTLQEVGLGYLPLGLQATKLSGGEAQRIKLSKELSKRSTGRTLYILDEPTTGLHFDDIAKLLAVLQRLVDNGNTVIVIEHNLDVIKTADYIIDLGPEGGDMGGRVLAVGTPEQIAAVPKSFTGQYLKKLLSANRNRRRKKTG
ncbi:MAG: excinuclease ABC subunit UvrA [Candidatus Lernaella stagnicola]|nr:excinuclease ABC subunit UvrA [Candidatus Lernaella stagnicola]